MQECCAPETRAYHADARGRRRFRGGVRRRSVPGQRHRLSTGKRNMQLTRNVMALALISAGIGFAGCSNVAFAAAAAATAQGQDQSPANANPGSQNAPNTAGKGEKKNEKKKAEKQVTQLQAINV